MYNCIIKLQHVNSIIYVHVHGSCIIQVQINILQAIEGYIEGSGKNIRTYIILVIHTKVTPSILLHMFALKSVPEVEYHNRELAIYVRMHIHICC